MPHQSRGRGLDVQRDGWAPRTGIRRQPTFGQFGGGRPCQQSRRPPVRVYCTPSPLLPGPRLCQKWPALVPCTRPRCASGAPRVPVPAAGSARFLAGKSLRHAAERREGPGKTLHEVLASGQSVVQIRGVEAPGAIAQGAEYRGQESVAIA